MSTYESLRNDGRDTTASGTRSLSEQSSRVLDEVKELGSTALATASEAAAQLRERGAAAVDATKQRAEEAKGQFDQVVSDNPLKSMLIALGIGAIVGFTLHRR